jgi:hypothetical protein
MTGKINNLKVFGKKWIKGDKQDSQKSEMSFKPEGGEP